MEKIEALKEDEMEENSCSSKEMLESLRKDMKCEKRREEELTMKLAILNEEV